MTDIEILVPLKVDLQISTNALDMPYLLPLIAESRALIAREGITLRDTVDDGMLVEMYAAYLYRARKSSNDSTVYRSVAFGTSTMPQMLRLALNNRLFSEKAGEIDG